MESLADFGTVSYFGVSTFTTEIYNTWFVFDDLKKSNFLSLILLIFILFFFVIENISRKNSKFHQLKNDGGHYKKKLTGVSAFAAFFFLFLFYKLYFSIFTNDLLVI